VLRYLVVVLALGFAARAYADDRSDARAHYQAGVKFYAGGDYRGAIREFSAAQQIAPADLNNYNLALCYDKLGDAEPAVQYYRAFLDKQPASEKRAEIEASIDRLEAASRSVARKRADEARRADDTRAAESARAKARADRASKASPADTADDARPPAGPVLGPSLGPSGPEAVPPQASASGAPPSGPMLGPPAPGETHRPAGPDAPAEGRKHGPAIQGTLGTPGAPGLPSAGPQGSTGDPQLDRVNAIDIDQIRDQRAATLGASGAGPAQAGPAQPGEPAAPATAGGPAQPLPGSDQPKKEDPVYKKWWFWAVVGVSAVVLYTVATDNSQPAQQTRMLPRPGAAIPTPGGLTLMRW
jgi:hypothetical protein